MNFFEILIHLWFLGGMPTPANPPANIPASLAMAAPAEQDYYDRIFVYVMDNVPPNKQYDWQGYDVKGSIIASENFISKSGYSCRTYSQTFVVQGNTSADQGIACKRHTGEGWCRLKKDFAETCAMEPPKNDWDEAVRGAKDFMNNGSTKMNTAKYNSSNWLSR